MGARCQRPWSAPEEARLLLWSRTQVKTPCTSFARATGRTPASVRVKLCRLKKDPLNRPPELSGEGSPDAAAPRVSSARGPGGTSDGN